MGGSVLVYAGNANGGVSSGNRMLIRCLVKTLKASGYDFCAMVVMNFLRDSSVLTYKNGINISGDG